MINHSKGGNGNVDVVSTRELAWNVTGENIVNGPMTAEQALTKAGLAGWNVRPVKMQTVLDPTATEDSHLIVPERFANVATIDGESKVLGVVGNRYSIFQNEESAELLDTIVDEGGANFVAGGKLNGGRKMFMVMKMPSGILIGGEDASDLFLGITNSHDGTGSLVAWVTGMRLACTNMLNGSIKGAKSKWRLRHTGGLKGKVAEARESLALTFQWAEEFELVGNALLSEKFSARQFDNLLNRLEPAKDGASVGWTARQDEKRDTLRYLFTQAETNELGRGTKWGAYNAFTEYADWFMPIKGQDADGTKRAARIMDSTSLDAYKQQALDLLVTV